MSDKHILEAAGKHAHDYEKENIGVHPKTAMFASFVAGANYMKKLLVKNDDFMNWLNSEEIEARKVLTPKLA